MSTAFYFVYKGFININSIFTSLTELCLLIRCMASLESLLVATVFSIWHIENKSLVKIDFDMCSIFYAAKKKKNRKSEFILLKQYL